MTKLCGPLRQLSPPRSGRQRRLPHGGEELLVILPEQDLAAAKVAAERLRQAIQALELPHPASPASAVMTVSIGVAASDTPMDCGAEEVLKASDEALYRAKSAGRNRVEGAQGGWVRGRRA